MFAEKCGSLHRVLAKREYLYTQHYVTINALYQGHHVETSESTEYHESQWQVSFRSRIQCHEWH